MQRRLQIAGSILILGLLVEAISLLFDGAIAFVLFVGLGGLLLLAGIAVYLVALVHPTGERT